MNYILHGSDKNRVSQKLQAIKNKHKIENIIQMDASNPEDDFLHEIDSFSIFDDEKMIIVDNASFLSAKNETRYKEIKDKKKNVIDINEITRRFDTDYIVVYICYSDKLDTRRKAVKEMVNSKNTTVYACLALDEKSQKAMVDDLLNRHKIKMGIEAKRYLYNHVGLDPLHIEKEIEKLSVYSNNLVLEDVKALISSEPTQDIFKMTDAYFDKNALKLLAYYRNFRLQNMEPVAIVALLASQIRFLYQISVLVNDGYSQQEIAGLLKAHPYRVQLSMRKAERFSSEELLGHLEDLADFDQNMKMGKVDKDIGFEQFVLRMLINK